MCRGRRGRERPLDLPRITATGKGAALGQFHESARDLELLPRSVAEVGIVPRACPGRPTHRAASSECVQIAVGVAEAVFQQQIGLGRHVGEGRAHAQLVPLLGPVGAAVGKQADCSADRVHTAILRYLQQVRVLLRTRVEPHGQPFVATAVDIELQAPHELERRVVGDVGAGPDHCRRRGCRSTPEHGTDLVVDKPRHRPAVRRTRS